MEEKIEIVGRDRIAVLVRLLNLGMRHLEELDITVEEGIELITLASYMNDAIAKQRSKRNEQTN